MTAAVFVFGLTHQAFPLLLDGVDVGVGLDAVDSTTASLLAMASIFLCFWDSLVERGECLMPVLTLRTGGGKSRAEVNKSSRQCIKNWKVHMQSKDIGH